MKYIFTIAILAVSLICTNAFAQHGSPKPPKEMPLTTQEQKLFMDCNLVARNSLINGDIAKVERTCMMAVKEMEKSHPDKDYLIHPVLNLAFTYSLMGDYDKAEPLLARAKSLGEKFYKPGSKEMKSIDDFIEDHNKRKEEPVQFDKNAVVSPH